jgi:uncharacterized protein
LNICLGSLARLTFSKYLFSFVIFSLLYSIIPFYFQFAKTSIINPRMSDFQSAEPILLPRRARVLIDAALEDTRVVLISGPRQSGKTTLARTYANASRLYVTLDDGATLKAALTDPVSFIRGTNKMVIDEVQRAPELILAIKERVDREGTVGQFLLTGSANLSTIPLVADSLAGRMEVIRLFPLAQAEIRNGPGQFLDWLFEPGDINQQATPIFGNELVHTVLLGGYPEVLRRKSVTRRQAWFDSYIKLILDRDVRDIANIDQLDRLPRLLSLLAGHAGQLVNYSTVGAALGLSHVTTQKYVGLLERLFLMQTLPPWSTNAVSRIIKSPKLQFLDSGLLASLRAATSGSILADRQTFGPLLESFVFAELSKLISWSGGKYRLSHFRTREGAEVDFVIEDRRGRIVGIEVKSSASIRPKDLNGLRKLQEAAGEKFVRGIVLHDHDRPTPYGPALSAGPVSLLWTL